MRQQQYEQALKDIRNVLREANECSSPYTGISEAVAIINNVLQKHNSVKGSDMSDDDRKASLDRDEANEYSGQ